VPYILPVPFIPPASAYMDSTVWLIRDFLYQNVSCDSSIISGVENLAAVPAVAVYPNPSEDIINLTALGNEDLVAEVFSMDGKLLARKLIYANSVQHIAKNEVGTGVFQVTIFNAKNASSRKTERVIFY
jgi:hypothetical protein